MTTHVSPTAVDAEAVSPLRTTYRLPRKPIALDPWHGSKVNLRQRQLAAFVGLIGLWSFVSGRFINSCFIGTPLGTLEKLWEWITDGTLWHHISVTFVDSTLGFLVGATFGVS